MTAIKGQVSNWDSEGGFGVIESTETPGGCWAHFSALHPNTLFELRPQQAVTFEFEVVDQDGYQFRATKVWLT